MRDASLLLRGDRVLVGSSLVEGVDVLVSEGAAAVGPRGSFGSAGRVLSAPVVSPGFVDLHVHALDGCGMVATPDVPGLSAALVRRGVTSFLATTVTAPLESLHAAVVAASVGGGPARCLGVHLEGPWISPARLGAQPPEFVRAPSVPELLSLVAAGPVRLVTLAPELPGALELVAAARAHGVRVSLGHSDCTHADAARAVDAGASHVTHCFNAMSGLHHRAPGLVGAAFDLAGLTVEVIADGVHVHPAAVRALVAAAGRDRVCLISDAVDCDAPPRVLGTAPATTLGTHDATAEEDGVRLADGTLAGTRVGVDAGVRNLVAWGVPLEDALVMAAVTPLRALGLEASLTDAVLLDDDLRPLATVVDGSVVWQRPDFPTLTSR